MMREHFNLRINCNYNSKFKLNKVKAIGYNDYLEPIFLFNDNIKKVSDEKESIFIALIESLNQFHEQLIIRSNIKNSNINIYENDVYIEVFLNNQEIVNYLSSPTINTVTELDKNYRKYYLKINNLKQKIGKIVFLFAKKFAIC